MTYTPGTEHPGASLDSQSRADLDKPQGLKSAPNIPNPDYPHLGFNPVPGSTEIVRNLHKKLTECAKVLAESHDLVTKLMDGSYWQGDAAVAFREQLDMGPLPLNLKNAAQSIGKAAKQLGRWEIELEEFQRRAKRLEEDAKDARAAVDAAEGRASSAKGDPDLQQKGSRHDDAQKALTRANTAVDDAQAALDDILRKARNLAEEHEQKAQYRAGKIRDATKKLAPQEPGWLEDIGSWFSENLPDILSFAAGVVGLVALFVLTGGMAAAVLLLAAAALSATALTLRLSDPAAMASLKDGFTKGEFDSDFWGNVVSMGGDVLGALPGAGAVGRSLIKTAEAGGEALTLGQRLAAFGTHTMEEARAISDLKNPLLDVTVRGARNSEKASKIVEITSASLGVSTAGYGLLSSAVNAVENDGVKDGATGVDGLRSILDGGGIVDLARYVF